MDGGWGGVGGVSCEEEANSVIIAVSHCVEVARGVEVTARQSAEGKGPSRVGCVAPCRGLAGTDSIWAMSLAAGASVTQICPWCAIQYL